MKSCDIFWHINIHKVVLCALALNMVCMYNKVVAHYLAGISGHVLTCSDAQNV